MNGFVHLGLPDCIPAILSIVKQFLLLKNIPDKHNIGISSQTLKFGMHNVNKADLRKAE